MDKRYLSQPDVIKASRNFVCIRLMTYESADEAQVLKRYWRRGQDLENTVFVILDPSGRPLMRGMRSPQRFFQDSSALANSMNKIASSYRSSSSPKELPLVDTLRLGMNVAACDQRPLAIVVSNNKTSRDRLESNLAPYAWSKQYIGKVIYTASKSNELNGVIGARPVDGYIFVSPNTYGTRAKVIAQLGANPTRAQLVSAYNKVIAWQPPQKASSHRDHARQGRMQGAQWETQIPITDRHTRGAMENRNSRFRGRGNRPYNQGYRQF